VLLLISAVTDAADGIVARRLDQRTRFGAIADPLADKLTMLTLAILLAWLGKLPPWFAAAIVARDVVIVAGALAYQLVVGSVEMAPTQLSKLNTVLEFLLLVAVLAIAAGLVESGLWFRLLLWLTAATIVLSGIQYVVAWSVKAKREKVD
jgi:cardiolipin synthase